MNTTFSNIPIEKQTRIINCALDEFARRGYENASTNNMVKALGIAKGSLFKYFVNKFELYSYLVDYVSNMLLRYLSQCQILNKSPMDALMDYASYEYDFLIEFPEVYQFFYSLQKDMNHPDLVAIKVRLIDLSNAYLDKIFNETDLDYESGKPLKFHVAFIIKGYNEAFMKNISNEGHWAFRKALYLKGLKQHLELIRW